MKTLIIFFVSFILLSTYSVTFNLNDLSINTPVLLKNEQSLKNSVLKKLSRYQQKLNAKITKVIRKVKTGEDYSALLWGALLCFAYGVIHALGPGHSKSIIASYFISNEEKLIKVPIMAFQISLTHVVTPIILVLLLDKSLSQVHADPESQLYWFKFISYLSIVIIGVVLMVLKIKNFKKPCDHEHPQDEGDKKKSLILALSAGLVPCIGSLMILLFTMANKIFFAGVILVLFIGLGIGVTITAVGVISYYFRKFIQGKNPDIGNSKAIKFVELAGTAFIILLGVTMFIGLFASTGAPVQ